MRPMLATATTEPGVPPAGEQWVHEVKWDGIRLLADAQDSKLRLFNRNEIDVTVAYPEIVREAARALPDDILLDGEVVVLDASGRPSLQAIAHRMHVRDPRRIERLTSSHPVSYLVFDVMRLQGNTLVSLQLQQRRELLEALDVIGGDSPVWQLSHLHDDGAALAEATASAELEGVMSKDRTSTYQPGVRSPAWVKVPHRREIVAVIGGWVAETDHPNRLGSVWIGHPHDEATFEAQPVLYPLGRAGSGLSHTVRDDLLQVLREIEQPTCPFDPKPTGPEARRTRWVEPLLSVQVRYLNIGDSGTLRQPVLRAVRPDVAACDAANAALVDVDG